MDAIQIVQNSFKAIGEKDFATIRSYLRDDLSYQDPTDTFNKANPLQGLKRFSAIVKRVDVKKCSSMETMFVSSTTWLRTLQPGRRLSQSGFR